jgi:hypothetical protein
MKDAFSQLNTRILWICGFMFVPLAMVWAGVWLRQHYNKPVTEKFKVILLCFSWMTTSVGMHTLNKDLVSILYAPSVITALQMCMASLVMLLFNFYKIQEVVMNHPTQCLRWLVVPGAFSGMLLTSFFTYKYVTLSVMTVVRNLAPLISMPIEMCLMPPSKRPAVSSESIAAMCCMLAGAILYGVSAASAVSLIGIGFAFFNMFLAIADRMLQRRLLIEECKDLNLEACTFLNNLLGMVPAILVARMTNETSLVELHSVDWTNPGIMLLLALSGLVGLGICFFGLAVQKCISATSFLVLQNISKFAVVTVGIAVFGDPLHSHFIIIGLLFSLGGSCWYGKSQIDAAVSEEQKPLVQQKIDPPKADGVKVV